MKKILSIIAGVALATGAFAQGTVSFANNSGTLVTTNGGTIGNTATAAQGFYYALFIQSYTGSVTSDNNPLTGGWTFTGSYATNTAATTGGRFSGGTATVTGWAAGATNQFLVVGWSSNLGASWAAIASQVQNGWTASGFYGASSTSFGSAGGGSQSLPTFSLFTTTGPNAQGNPIQTGFTLNAVSPVVTPEPTTLALAGLGGASLLLFRRRK
jgi:hypothetical protein